MNGATISRALDPASVTNAFEVEPAPRSGRAFVCIDASSLRGDSFAWVCGYESTRGLVIGEVDGVDDAALSGATMGQVVAMVAARAKAWGTDVVFGDQREEAGLATLFAQHGLSFITIAWTETSKHSAFTLLSRILKDQQLSLCEHDTLLHEAKACKVQLMPSGRHKYSTNGLDYLSALITLMHAVNNGDIEVAKLPDRAREAGGHVQTHVSPMDFA